MSEESVLYVPAVRLAQGKAFVGITLQIVRMVDVKERVRIHELETESVFFGFRPHAIPANPEKTLIKFVY